ncbi:hypothetical protein [Streptomyces atroolivaceus]|uniref:hypothetical protein n=1 Tax=Streptomyces atroolivaceus TaxID=66869 RepID=UPI0036420070
MGAQLDERQHVMVVSLRKSGTHLLREVMTRLGYKPYGVTHEDEEDATATPAEIERLLRAAYGQQEADRLLNGGDSPGVAEAFAAALVSLDRLWGIRLGGRLKDFNLSQEYVPTEVDARLARMPETESFRLLPSTPCLFLHSLSIQDCDPDFLKSWNTTGYPRIIFNYRDWRDTVLSMVNYLSKKSPASVGQVLDHHIYREILTSLPSMEDKITLALTDPNFPGMEQAQRCLWLLRHPRVCKVSFEELVGPHGSGSKEAQRAAVERIIRFVGSGACVESVAGAIYNPASKTFYKGRTGRWKEHFTQAHHALVEQKHADMVSAYQPHTK